MLLLPHRRRLQRRLPAGGGAWMVRVMVMRVLVTVLVIFYVQVPALRRVCVLGGLLKTAQTQTVCVGEAYA